jgi:hypothetical protein
MKSAEGFRELYLAVDEFVAVTSLQFPQGATSFNVLAASA